jgi:hypothetical protein
MFPECDTDTVFWGSSDLGIAMDINESSIGIQRYRRLAAGIRVKSREIAGVSG